MHLKTVFIIFMLSAFAFACGTRNDFDTKTYEEQKKTVAQKEEDNPLEFLKLKSDNKKNLFGSTVIKGSITNSATVCTYSAMRIKLLSFKDGKQVEEHEDVVDGPLKPGGSVDFKIKYHLPRGTDSIDLSIMSAHPVVHELER